MLSLNPMHDFTDESSYGKGSADDRAAPYKEFEAAGMGISVMKAFAGGQLLDAKASPFGSTLTPFQCIQCALDKPGVLTVLPGIRGKGDLLDALAFLDAAPEQRDHSVIGEFAPPEAAGTCVYRNHCQPYPEDISIELADKHYDLARLDDDIATGNHRNLVNHASNCTAYGHCDRRCPFGVAQSSCMGEIAGYIGA